MFACVLISLLAVMLYVEHVLDQLDRLDPYDAHLDEVPRPQVATYVDNDNGWAGPYPADADTLPVKEEF